MYAKKNSGKKTLAMLLAVVLLIGVGVGGTLAWLQDSTTAVTNTFTVGNIDIDLKEHVLNDDGKTLGDTEVTSEDSYKIVPGSSQPKDPFVRVEANSDACWVFIKVEELKDAGKYITYSIDKTVWTPLVDENKDGIADDGVYYHEMEAVTADTELNILSGQQVSYPGTLTKADLDALYVIETDDAGNVISMTRKDAEELPKLQFTGYAIQKTGENGTEFTAETAWDALNPATGA